MLVVVLIVVGVSLGAGRVQAEDAASGVPLVLPIVVHVGREAGAPVVDEAFVTQQLARANTIFAPYGVGFRLRQTIAGPDGARMETRADRDALGAHVRAGVINCFVVASLRDVDEPSRMRRGVHWHSKQHPGVHYVVLSAISEPEVLAHELGHFLGHPRHSDTPGNLMSYTPGEGPPFLDRAQVHRMHEAIRRYVRRRELTLEQERQEPAREAEGTRAL